MNLAQAAQVQSVEEFLRGVLLRLATTAACTRAYQPNWSPDFCAEEIDQAWRDKGHGFFRPTRRRLTAEELRAASPEELHKLGFANWDENLVLIPLWAWNYVADDEELTCISGKTAVKGRDYIDLDQRDGALAWGFTRQ